MTYEKVFDDLHRLDGLPWQTIGRIVQHACEEWTSGMILSPSKLRVKGAVKAYPELPCWQVIEQQMSGEHRKRDRGDDDLDDLMEQVSRQ
jgi:hypothetical protein